MREVMVHEIARLITRLMVMEIEPTILLSLNAFNEKVM